MPAGRRSGTEDCGIYLSDHMTRRDSSVMEWAACRTRSPYVEKVCCLQPAAAGDVVVGVIGVVEPEESGSISA